MNKKAGTRYSLVPTNPKDIVTCAIGSCLAVGGFFAIIHVVALITRVMS